MFMCGTLNGPPWGYCLCGWPLLRDGTCSNGECSEGWSDPDNDIIEEPSE